MKTKYILALFFLIVGFSSFSQVYRAGDTLAVYYDVNPDTLVNYVCSFMGGGNESYYMDINMDFQSDLQIDAYCSPGSAMGGWGRSISITSLNSDLYVRLVRLDSVWNSHLSVWGVTKVAKPLQYGDSINSQSAKWDNTTLFLTSYSGGLSGYSTSISDWVSINDEYLGIKYQNTTDTIYGWIRVNCPSAADCYIKDYSFGGSGLGVTNFKSSSISIYPNPTTGFFTIQSSEKISSIKIVNVLGEKVYEQAISHKRTESSVDLSKQQSGIYFLQLKTTEGIVTKKIIVQR